MRTLPFQGNRKIKCATISPLGLALTACGGGGTKEPEVITEINRHSEFVTFDLTGNDFIDASTQGSKWVPTDGVITFALADGFNGERWANPDEALEVIIKCYAANCRLHQLRSKKPWSLWKPRYCR